MSGYEPDMRKLLDKPLPDGPLYVHFDTDLLDSRIAPAFLYAVPGGPRRRMSPHCLPV